MRGLLLLSGALLAPACVPGDDDPGDTDATDTPQPATCDVPGTICTVAGNGDLGFNGDALPALDTMLYYPSAVLRAPDGRLLVDDFNNNRIRRLTAEGDLVTMAGNGVHGWATEGAPILESDLENPVDIDISVDGTLLIDELHTNRILEVVDDEVTIFSGNGLPAATCEEGATLAVGWHDPSGIAVAPDGAVYVSDTSNHCVREIGADGQVRRIAGDGLPGAVDGTGNPRLNRPQRLVVDGGRVLVADSGNHRVIAVDRTTGDVTLVAGNPSGNPGWDGDGGPADEAELTQPYAVAVAPDGALIVADFGNHLLRRVDPDGTISTIAGTGEPGFGGDGGPATEAALNYPSDVWIDPDGTIFVTDMFNGRVRRIAPPR